MIPQTCVFQNNVCVDDRFGRDGRLSIPCRKRFGLTCFTIPRALYGGNKGVFQVIQVVTAFILDTVRCIPRDVGVSVLIVDAVNARLLRLRRCQRGIWSRLSVKQRDSGSEGIECTYLSLFCPSRLPWILRKAAIENCCSGRAHTTVVNTYCRANA